MKKNVLTAIAFGLALLPFADGALAQSCTSNYGCPPAQGQTSAPPTPKVCFYTGADYKGIYFCEAGIRSVSAVPPQWRAKIKSITVGEHTTVRICPVDLLQGQCDTIGQDTKKLPTGLFNHVHSYAITQAL